MRQLHVLYYRCIIDAYMLKFSAVSDVVDVLQIILLFQVEEMRLFLICCWYALANIAVEVIAVVAV